MIMHCNNVNKIAVLSKTLKWSVFDCIVAIDNLQIKSNIETNIKLFPQLILKQKREMVCVI